MDLGNQEIKGRSGRGDVTPRFFRHHQYHLRKYVVNPKKSTFEGQGDENSDAVSVGPCLRCTTDLGRGLDNAGKTTIVKRIMKEDTSTVSPTLGFIIKTIDFQG